MSKKNKDHIFFLLLALLSACLAHASANEALTICFAQLEGADAPAEGIRVRIRGFLYPTDDHEKTLVLAAEPNVKSCCLHKVKNKLAVSDAGLQSTGSQLALLLEGQLIMKNGSWLLEDAVIVEETHAKGFLLGLLAACLLLLLWCIFRLLVSNSR
jgi:hypothetical protein